MAVRLYSFGYDVFCPTITWAHHLWEKAHRRCFDDKLSGVIDSGRATARSRVKRMLDGQPPLQSDQTWPVPGKSERPLQEFAQLGSDKIPGVATSRSLLQFEKSFGVDFKAKVLLKAAKTALADESYLEPEKIVHTELWRPPTKVPWLGNPCSSTSENPLFFLEPANRGDEVVVCPNALDPAFAAHCAVLLKGAPKSAWLQMDGDRQHVLNIRQQQANAKGGVKHAEEQAVIVPMRFVAMLDVTASNNRYRYNRLKNVPSELDLDQLRYKVRPVKLMV